MSRFHFPVPALALAMACTAPVPALAQHHMHAAQAVPAQSWPAAPGHRHATDAALRKGMADIRIAVGMLGHAEHGHLDAAQVRRLAADIEGAIGGIVAECKLDPQADAALHGIIGRLGAGVAALKAHPGDATPVAGMREALEDYARVFDDPGAATVARNAAN